MTPDPTGRKVYCRHKCIHLIGSGLKARSLTLTLDPKSEYTYQLAVGRFNETLAISHRSDQGSRLAKVQRLMCRPITQLRLKYVSTTDLTPGPSSYLRAFTSRQRDQGSRWIQRKSELSSTLNRTVIIKAHVQEPERTTTRGSAIYIS